MIISPELIDELLTLPSLEDQNRYLDGAQLAHAEGLSQLMEAAAGLMGQSPFKARELAGLTGRLAPGYGSPGLIPQANYIQAQAFAIAGQFAPARDLLEVARQGYLSQGEIVASLRTNIGLINILAELGDLDGAVAAGEALLQAIEQQALSERDTQMLTGLAQQNLGVCYRRLGRYEAALEAYIAAAGQFERLGMSARLGHIAINQGLVLQELGRVHEAARVLNGAIAQFTLSDDKRMLAKAYNNMGLVQQLQGDYGQALSSLEVARLNFDAINGAGAEHAILLLDLADTYLTLNLIPEARTTYELAAAELHGTGMAHYLARVSWGMGAALMAEWQYEAAQAYLADAVARFGALGNKPLQAGALLEQADLFSRMDSRGTALIHAVSAYELVKDNAWPIQHFFAKLKVAELMLPDTTAAAKLLLEAQGMLNQLPLPQLRFQVGQRLGRLYLAQGQRDMARQELETASRELESIRSTLVQESLRASFLQDKISVYEDLVALYLDAGDEASLQAAFATAERAKSQALVDLLNGLNSYKLSQADAASAARLEQLRRDLNALYNERFNEGTGGERRILATQLNRRIREMEDEVTWLQLQMGLAEGVPAGFPTPSTSQPLPAALADGTTLIAYHLLGAELIAFVYQDGHLQVQRALGSYERVQELITRLHTHWARFQAGPDFVARNLPQLERSAQRILGWLYEELFAPLADYLPAAAQVQPLVIVPHGVLHQVPFHALFDGRRYLLEAYEISYAPSATTYALCAAKGSRPAGHALVMGVADSRIPFVVEEVAAVSTALADSRTFLNESATYSALQGVAPGCRLLHLACHGLFRGDNPMFSALQLHDHWVT
ncbi:MAG: CHAT domain-containing protein, partial [Anaerolineales bacterium]|nr:CHAT domain-containing protein [Anaerolineales bacterium]